MEGYIGASVAADRIGIVGGRSSGNLFYAHRHGTERTATAVLDDRSIEGRGVCNMLIGVEDFVVAVHIRIPMVIAV